MRLDRSGRWLALCSRALCRWDSNIRSNAAMLPSVSQLVTPPGWPSLVRPPGAPAWERTASAWLLDICPPEFRGYPVLRRHVVVLARFAVLHVEACQAAVRRGLSEAGGALRDVADADTIEAAVPTLQAGQAGLLAGRRAVGLGEEPLRGRRFVARL